MTEPAPLARASTSTTQRTCAALVRDVRALAALAVIVFIAGCRAADESAETTTATIEIRQPPATAPDHVYGAEADATATPHGLATPVNERLRTAVPPLLAPSPPDQTAVAATADVPASAATAQELAELSARLDVPVQGVPRSALRDTYDESRGDRQHEALDILAPRGTPVLAATDGRVLRLFDSTPGGLMIYTTDAAGRFILFYGHLAGYAPGLQDGMPLRQGQVIGYVGTTGNAPDDTPHLHFGIMRGDPAASWSSGVPTNPYPLLVPSVPQRR